MFQIASVKIICTDSSEILFSQILLKSFFSKTRVCWFELSLAKTKFFTDPYCVGVSNKHCLLTFFIGVGVGLRLVAACRNSNRDMYIVCIFIRSATFNHQNTE